MDEPAADAGHKELEDHYERIFERIDQDFHRNSLNAIILDLVPKGKVLDIGCGSGALSVELLKHGRNVVSQDLSARMVEMCKIHREKNGFDDDVRLGGVETITGEEQFDAVIALDVIEHIEDDVEAVTYMKKALKPDGTLVLSVPALGALYGPKDRDIGHYRRYSRAGLLRVIDAAGFDVTSCRYWNVLGILPTWLNNLRGKRVDDSIRYADSPAKKALNAGLRTWFRVVENPIKWPIGMTLIITAKIR